jgi:hypothetical protein
MYVPSKAHVKLCVTYICDWTDHGRLIMETNSMWADSVSDMPDANWQVIFI